MMIRRFKYLLFLFCMVCPLFNAYCETDTDVKFTIVDSETQKPIKGINVETVNLRGIANGESDDQGIAIIKYKFNEDAKTIGQRMTDPNKNVCRNFLNQSDANTGKGPKLCTKDPEGVYGSGCVTITNKTGCNIKMKLHKKKSKKNYPSPEEMSELALTRGGNLKFYPVCDANYKDYPAKITIDKRHCVNDFFKGTHVQMLAGEELAKIYAIERHNQLIDCDIMYETRNGDDYLQCVSIDNVNNETHAYEFRFRNLNARKGMSLGDDGYSIQHSAANALCRLPGGKYVVAHNICTKDLSDQTKDQDLCHILDPYAQRFGWNAKYGEYEVNEYITNKGCLFDFNKIESSDEIENEDAFLLHLNPYAFSDISVQSKNDMVMLLEQYVRHATRLTNNIKQVECAKGFRDYKSGEGQVVSCKITTQVYYVNEETRKMDLRDGGVYNVNFVFKSVNETNATKAADGKAGMSCITSGGNFDGKNCTSIGKLQCNALKSELPGGAVWNEKLGVCTMSDSIAARDAEKREFIAKTAAGVVVGVVLAPAGGAAAIIAWTSMGVSTLSSVALDILQENQNDFIRDFVVTAETCRPAYQCDDSVFEEYGPRLCPTECNPNSSCSKDALLNAYGELKYIMKPENEMPSQLSKAVNFAHEKLWTKITPNCVDKSFATRLKNTTSKFQKYIYIAQGVGAAASLFNLASGGVESVQNVSNAVKAGQAMTISLKNMHAIDAINKAWNFYGTVGDVSTVLDTKSSINDSEDTRDNYNIEAGFRAEGYF